MHNPTWHMPFWTCDHLGGDVLKEVSAACIEGFNARAAKAHSDEGNNVKWFPLVAFGWGLILGSVCWSRDLGCAVWCPDTQMRDLLKSVEVSIWVPWAAKQYLGATVSYQTSSAFFFPSFPRSGQTLWRTELNKYFHPLVFHSHYALPCLR